MKKLLVMVSALTAGLFSAANADITISGSGGIGVASGSGGNSTVVNGSAISIGLSSDLGNGVVISTSAGLSLDSDAAVTGAAAGVTGLHTFTIATGGSTIKVGADVDMAGDGVGELGSVGSDLNDLGGYGTGSVGGGLLNEDGYGIGLTTAVGTATFTGSYLMDNKAAPDNNAVTDGTVTASGFQVSIPMGGMTIVAGYGQDDVAATGGTTTGIELSMALGGGTLSVGTFDTNKNLAVADTKGYGAKYATTMGSASVSVGYRNREDTTNKRTSTVTSASVSQSIGTGASVYLDVVNYSGYATADDTGTNVAIGTSFTF
tara:strand:- start:4407 stop:5360 length:954 start_codon:yes stop_codon:yes gene_type:complete